MSRFGAISCPLRTNIGSIACLLSAAVFISTTAAAQSPPTVIDPFAQISNQSANDGGFATGTEIRVGAVVTSPIVSGAFPGYGFMSQSGTNESLFFRSDAFKADQIFQTVPASTGLDGSWTLHVSSTPTFAPGTVTTISTPAPGSVATMPFVQSMTITADPTGLNPTINWTLPNPGTGPTIDEASITISDNSNPISVTSTHLQMRAPWSPS